MDNWLLFTLLLSGLDGVCSRVLQQYHFVNQNVTWGEAKEYCKNNFTDLATVENKTDMQNMMRAVKDGYNEMAWIGLRKTEVGNGQSPYNPAGGDGKPNKDYWKWSDQTTSLFRFWGPGIPDNSAGNEDCAVTLLNEEGKWGDSKCDEKHPFFCQDNKRVLVRENKTWLEAFEYCEGHGMSLVSVSSEKVFGWVRKLAQGASGTTHVWLGLYYICPLDLWLWISGVTVCCDNWAPGNGTGTHGCGMAGALQAEDGKWVSRPLNERLNFICTSEGV